MWYIPGQQVHWKYWKKKYRPILKTCPIEKKRIFKNKNRSSCGTEICHKDSDCLSGKCSYWKCIFDEKENGRVIYLCSGEEEEEFMKCGKNGGMRANERKECYSNLSSNNFCLPPLRITKRMLKYIYIIAISYIALLIITTIIKVIVSLISKRKKQKQD